MKKVLSPWCKQAKKELIERDMTIKELLGREVEEDGIENLSF